MTARHTFVTRLLQHYHSIDAVVVLPADLPNAGQTEYFCDVGLGPIAFHVYGDALQRFEPESYKILKSADLTTRVIYRQLEQATTELAVGLNDCNIKATLLKGISVASEFYKPPHLRVMGDIDVLIRQSDAQSVMVTVAAMDYEIADEQWREFRSTGHHHLPAARHQPNRNQPGSSYRPVFQG